MSAQDPEKPGRKLDQSKAPAARAARLKAALQANIARRKAQARARADATPAMRQDQEDRQDG